MGTWGKTTSMARCPVPQKSQGEGEGRLCIINTALSVQQGQSWQCQAPTLGRTEQSWCFACPHGHDPTGLTWHWVYPAAIPIICSVVSPHVQPAGTRGSWLIHQSRSIRAVSYCCLHSTQAEHVRHGEGREWGDEVFCALQLLPSWQQPARAGISHDPFTFSSVGSASLAPGCWPALKGWGGGRGCPGPAGASLTQTSSTVLFWRCTLPSCFASQEFINPAGKVSPLPPSRHCQPCFQLQELLGHLPLSCRCSSFFPFVLLKLYAFPRQKTGLVTSRRW